MKVESHALIIGAGPAGACLAYILASRGIEVTLLERQLDFAREFRGEVLMPSGTAVLDELEIEGLEKIPHRVPTSVEAFARGRPFFRQDLDPTLFGGKPPVATSQPALLERLVAAAERFPSFQFERGATVLDLLRDGDRIVGVRARTSSGEKEFRAQLILGADGRSSVLRRRAGISPLGQPQIMDVVWSKFPLPESLGDEAPARAYIGQGHLLFAYRSPDDKLQVAWVILKGGFGELRASGFEAWIDEMAENVSPDYSEHFRNCREQVGRPFLLSSVLDRVPNWSLPGLLLIGDAAHTMSPVGGQGLNIALRDAVVAANHLVPAFRTGANQSALDAAAQRIQAERLPEVVRIQRLQAMPPRVMMNPARWAGLARVVIPLLARLPGAQTLGARALSVFAFGVTEVRLKV
jgi:2-polyprenyl-6-methoxyphenol hydroxylase-like FAD-dependent oxidoreductase